MRRKITPTTTFIGDPKVSLLGLVLKFHYYDWDEDERGTLVLRSPSHPNHSETRETLELIEDQ
jgi:hypothetical protein